MALPAHKTKHIPSLSYSFFDATFSLAQCSDGHSNGTALWLGAQCLSVYLATVQSRIRRAPSASGHRPRALELGSGIGLSALALRSMGWDILATDTSHVIYSVLAPNIGRNGQASSPTEGAIEVRELDWTVPPEQWNWDHPAIIASPTATSSTAVDQPCLSTLRPPFDLIISSDTLYSAELVQPLLRTLHAASEQSLVLGRSPPIYLCIERRDTAVIDRALDEAQSLWNFVVERIPHRKVLKAMEKGRLLWTREDWEGVEIWKLALKRDKAVQS
ncbi:hypothetical protein FA95DRAFT_1676432 [Auriscalpium vulgare]|uniref:Uncharacterized protein n=1 Tax=Auriscalpium vulgare TaxID=40419 RepID=A0ACB8S3G3_9AGAM|nr:hypothetical protein FA95DRAFT_1676432 [Auriscalpium vulgare]